LDWKTLQKGFESFLKLERSLSENSISAYKNDVSKLAAFMAKAHPSVNPKTIDYNTLLEFVYLNAKIGQERQKQHANSPIR